MADSLSAISGLASGIDYRALVDAIIASERRPANAAQAQIDLAAKRQEAVGTWRTLLTTFRTALDKLRTGSALDTARASVLGATTDGRPLFTAAAASTARPGSYEVEVIALARAEKLGSRPVADPAAVLGLDGQFTLNGVAITVTASDSLTAIRDRINEANAGATPTRVSATILTVGPGDSRLVLTSQVTGAAGIAHADASGGVLADLALVGGGAVLVDGTDASFTIDGVPLTRSSNVIADAISGVTLTLAAEAEGTIGTLEISRDPAATAAAGKAVVEAYNGMLKFLKEQSAPGETPPPLYGDPMLRLARTALARGMLGVIAGETGNPATGSAAGFSLSKTGELSLDESKLSTLHATQFEQLRTLFTEGAGAADLGGTLEAALATNTGSVDLKSRFLTDRILVLQDRIDRIESRLDRRRTLLLQQFSRMEAALGALQSQASFITAQASGFNRTRQ